MPGIPLQVLALAGDTFHRAVTLFKPEPFLQEAQPVEYFLGPVELPGSAAPVQVPDILVGFLPDYAGCFGVFFVLPVPGQDKPAVNTAPGNANIRHTVDFSTDEGVATAWGLTLCHCCLYMS